MTASALNAYTHRDLVQMAKKRGVPGYHAMRKDELVRAILRDAKKKKTTSVNGKKTIGLPHSAPATNGHHSVNGKNGHPSRIVVPPKDPRVVRRIEQAKVRLLQSKDLSAGHNGSGRSRAAKDRLIVMVRGPFWLHCNWELAPQSIQRASVAMGQLWHAAQPILRVLRVDSAQAGAGESVERDIKIHGRVKNWYVDIREPQQNYRLEIGYLADNGRFLSLARSNVVSTPSPDRGDIMDPHWTDVAENCDKIYAMSGGYNHDGATSELQEMFEERLHRPMGSPLVTRYGAGAEGLLARGGRLKVDLEAEVILHGATQPDAYVTLQGEPIKVRPDGSFTVRCDFPNRRQVIPVVVATKDGIQQRTVVLAVERNTKILEPLVRESVSGEEV